jgi:hemerythrin-like domain-containing protein
MDNHPKPIKRSEQLAPLSREHHEGLLFGWKIKQGLKNGTDHKIIAQFVQWFWQHHLHEHFSEEEHILATHLPAGDALVQHMTEEHQEIEALVHINEQIADEALLAKLANDIIDHIRFEERELFPYAERILPVEKLDLIYEQLSKEKAPGANWQDEFWLKK